MGSNPTFPAIFFLSIFSEKFLLSGPFSRHSLQGRYNHYRLHPFSLAELKGDKKTLNELLRFGGFPEPFSLKSEIETRKWSRQYRLRLVRENIQSLEKIKDLSLIEELLIRLPDCVGSPLTK